MSKYYQLSTDYDQADNLLKQGAKLAVYVHDGCYAGTSYGLGRDRNYYEQNKAKFLLPIPDPTIALQHSLTQALNEADELRHENAHQKELLEELRIAVNSNNKAETIRLLQIQIKNWQAMSEGQNEMIEELQEEKSSLNHELEIVRDSERLIELNNEKLAAKIKEQERIMVIMETEIESLRVDVAEHKKAYEYVSGCAVGGDLIKLGLEQRVQQLEKKNTVANEALTAIAKQLGFDFFSDDEVAIAIDSLLSRDSKLGTDLIDEMNTTAQLDDMIEAKDQDCTILKDKILNLEQALERAQDKIAQQRGIIAQNNKAFAQENERLLAVLEERCNKIDILEDNLDRTDSDRLSELTSIMRMLQAWESAPMLDRLSGAIDLIKRVIYIAIYKLDPSQAVDP